MVLSNHHPLGSRFRGNGEVGGGYGEKGGGNDEKGAGMTDVETLGSRFRGKDEKGSWDDEGGAAMAVRRKRQDAA